MSFTLMAKVMPMNVGNLAKKMVLLKLADQANDKGVCWPSYQTIAEACQVSRRTVIRHIKSLEADGFLTITKTYDKANKKNFSNRYQLTLDRGVELSLVTECHQPSDNVSASSDRVSLGSDRVSPEPIIEPAINRSFESINNNVSADVNTNTKENEKDLDGFDDIYLRLKNKLRASGILPIGKPVIDEHLRPDIYQFVSWCNSKNMEAYKQDSAVVAFFKKKDVEDRKKYYTPAADLTGRYYNEDNYQKAIPVTKEQAATIEAKHADVLLGLGF